MRFERVSVIGLGYIGLPTAAVLASKGYRVHGVDISDSVIADVNAGRAPLFEPELDELVAEASGAGRLSASHEYTASDVYVIAVPTPLKAGFAPNVDAVLAAAEGIAEVAPRSALVVIESTSPVGTTERVRALIEQRRPDLAGALRLAYCPERAIPGQTIKELVHNDRIICGIDGQSVKTALAFYGSFVKGQLWPTDCRIGEMVKLVENTFRDVAIAFANELSIICDHMDLDVCEVIELANRHPRVNILQPGVGVGGHCIPVDPYFIMHSVGDLTHLIRTAREVNRYKPHWVTAKVLERVALLADTLGRQPILACLGAAYKPDTGDIRESPALEIVSNLAERNACDLVVVDPFVDGVPPYRFVDLNTAIAEADLLVVLVGHTAFVELPLQKPVMDFTCVLDTRNQ